VAYVVVVTEAYDQGDFVQLMRRSPSKWFSDLVLNWRIPPAR